MVCKRGEIGRKRPVGERTAVQADMDKFVFPVDELQGKERESFLHQSEEDLVAGPDGKAEHVFFSDPLQLAFVAV